MSHDEESPTAGDSDRNFGDINYQWECPFCETSNVVVIRDPIRALKTHLRTTNGRGHGEAGSLPEDLSERELDEYVSPLDEG